MNVNLLDSIIKSLNREACGTFVGIEQNLEKEGFEVVDSEYRFDNDIRHLKGDPNVERIVEEYGVEQTYTVVRDWIRNLTKERGESPRCDIGNIEAVTEEIEESLEVQLYMLPADSYEDDTGYHAEVSWPIEYPIRKDSIANALKVEGMLHADLIYENTVKTPISRF